jgi:hypothetical protein
MEADIADSILGNARLLAPAGSRDLRYGGNTSCVEANGPDGTLIVLDCGTGAYDLGQRLLPRGRAQFGATS